MADLSLDVHMLQSVVEKKLAVSEKRGEVARLGEECVAGERRACRLRDLPRRTHRYSARGMDLSLLRAKVQTCRIRVTAKRLQAHLGRPAHRISEAWSKARLPSLSPRRPYHAPKAAKARSTWGTRGHASCDGCEPPLEHGLCARPARRWAMLSRAQHHR